MTVICMLMNYFKELKFLMLQTAIFESAINVISCYMFLHISNNFTPLLIIVSIDFAPSMDGLFFPKNFFSFLLVRVGSHGHF